MQTMRSWSTLQPGEQLSCVGCHESKNARRPRRAATLAMRRDPRSSSRSTVRRGDSASPRKSSPFWTGIASVATTTAQAVDWEPPVDRPVEHEGKAFSLLGTTTPEEKSGRRLVRCLPCAV